MDNNTQRNKLRISGNGSGLSIAIWTPMISPEGMRKYPQETRYGTMLVPRNVSALNKIIRDYLVPVYERGQDAKYSLFTNAVRSTLLEVECNNGFFYLNIYLECDATTRASNKKISFKFDAVPVLNKYDQATGEINVEYIQADFLLFTKAVGAYDDMVGGSVAGHGVRNADAFRNREFMDYLRAIATAVKAQLPAPVYQRTGGFNPPQNGAVQTQSGYSAPAEPVASAQMTEVHDITDLFS
jgi:hypothetical protein